MSLRRSELTLTMTVLISMTLLLPCVKADVELTSQLVEPVKRALLYIYYLKLEYGWKEVGKREWVWSSWVYPNQKVYYLGSLSTGVPAQEGSGYYAVTVKAYTWAGSDGGSGVADFLFSPYYVYIEYIKMSD